MQGQRSQQAAIDKLHHKKRQDFIMKANQWVLCRKSQQHRLATRRNVNC
jgi:hypothetical protein